MNKKKYIIAIDGPAGAGKSTVSKALAKRLGYIYIDTGAMYRALALKAIRQKLDFKNEAQVISMSEKTSIELKPGKTKDSLLSIFMDSEDITDKIRTEEVSQGASRISTISGVRKVLQEKQREIGKNGGIVMEGRDIGTVVFPNAEYKFYLDASADERALRRFKELKAKGLNVSLEDITKEVQTRDNRDMNRKADPLRAAPGSINIDSTGLTIEGTADVLIDRIKKDEQSRQ